jgi:hypothetical protein
MISAGDRLCFTAGRLAMRSASSFMLGRSASCSISLNTLNTKSESESPSIAARDFSFRCNFSGTLRTWIVLGML